MVMGRNDYGPKWSWAEMVMGRNDPESFERHIKVSLVTEKRMEQKPGPTPGPKSGTNFHWHTNCTKHTYNELKIGPYVVYRVF